MKSGKLRIDKWKLLLPQTHQYSRLRHSFRSGQASISGRRSPRCPLCVRQASNRRVQSASPEIPCWSASSACIPCLWSLRFRSQLKSWSQDLRRQSCRYPSPAGLRCQFSGCLPRGIRFFSMVSLAWVAVFLERASSRSKFSSEVFLEAAFSAGDGLGLAVWLLGVNVPSGDGGSSLMACFRF